MDLKKIKSELKGRVARGLNFGIEAVEEVVDPASDIFNDYILLKSKYNDLMYVSSQNTLPYEQLEIGLDRLRNNLISIIDRLEDSDLKGQEINPDLKVQALPTRRTNFFKLLDIHFKNLEAISYILLYGNEEVRKSGREAVFEIYQTHRHKFRNRKDLAGTEGKKILQQYFFDLFSNEPGILEVYFKNIKNMLSYALESEIERQFFLNILKTLFSRFELGLIFYYALSRIDPDFKDLIVKSRLIDDSVVSILIVEEHFDDLKD